MYEKVFKQTLEEITKLSEGIKGSDIDQVIDLLLDSNVDHIVGFGAGRMGYSMRAFIMRLCHIGLNSYMIGDTNFPRITKHSIVLVNSSSGETPTSLLYATQASRIGAKIICITQNRESQLATLSDVVLSYPKLESKQIMKTLPEQFSFILFDVLSELIIRKAKKNRLVVSENHSISE